MLFASDRQSVVDVVLGFEHVDKFLPQLSTLSRAHECFCVTNEDKTISGSGEEHVEPLWSEHEAYISIVVASSKGDNNNFALVTLEVIYGLLVYPN